MDKGAIVKTVILAPFKLLGWFFLGKKEESFEKDDKKLASNIDRGLGEGVFELNLEKDIIDGEQNFFALEQQLDGRLSQGPITSNNIGELNNQVQQMVKFFLMVSKSFNNLKGIIEKNEVTIKDSIEIIKREKQEINVVRGDVFVIEDKTAKAEMLGYIESLIKNNRRQEELFSVVAITILNKQKENFKFIAEVLQNFPVIFQKLSVAVKTGKTAEARNYTKQLELLTQQLQQYSKNELQISNELVKHEQELRDLEHKNMADWVALQQVFNRLMIELKEAA